MAGEMVGSAARRRAAEPAVRRTAGPAPAPSVPALPAIAVAVAVALLVLAGCAAVPEAGGDPTGPLTALQPCGDPPPGLDEPPAPGVVLPEGAVLLEQAEQGPVVNAAGYVGRTPIQVRLDYEAMDGREDVAVLSSEDEVFESELLLTAGDRRVFVRATAACATGSNLLVVAAPKGEDQAVPAPQGDGTVTD